MVLDDHIETKHWTERLQRREMDDCLFVIEQADITIGLGEPKRVYVGGILNNELWFSYGVDDTGYLLPHIERFPVDLIQDYKIIN